MPKWWDWAMVAIVTVAGALCFLIVIGSILYDNV